MKALACFAAILLGPLSLFAEGRTETELLRARASEQERQITALEKEIEQLREQVAFERRRARTTVLTDEGVDKPFSPSDATRKPPAPPETAVAKYTVQPGDNLSAIARRYNTTAPLLMRANGIKDPTRLQVGQTLKIPGNEPAVAKTPAPTPKPVTPKPAPVAPTPKPKPAPVASKDHTYTVKSGDNLYKVARIHGMTYSEITKLNPSIRPASLQIGQKLKVSSKPIAKDNTSVPPRKNHTVASNTPLPPAPKPTPAPPTPKPAPKPVSTITISDDISYDAFAASHGTTSERLNALNGLSLPGNTPLAKGSVLYVATN